MSGRHHTFGVRSRLTSHSAINQQIAIKTIKKFGFSVSAVWNGKEALDYLMEQGSPKCPKPDIILMDVQMPILDGYRATHLIRHHRPYSNINALRTIPIVAMTASAIQGDREKCRHAGMDDYLAKPVRGKTLESMLLKWAVEGKKTARSTEEFDYPHDDSSCTDPDSGPHTNSKATDSAKANDSDERVNRLAADSNALPGPGDEGDRAMRRAEAEEKATSLRNNKLYAASETDPYQQHNVHMAPSPTGLTAQISAPTALLTEENVTRHDREQGISSNSNNMTSGGGGPRISLEPPLPSAAFDHRSISSAGGSHGGLSAAQLGSEADSIAVHSRNSSDAVRSTVGSMNGPSAFDNASLGLAVGGLAASSGGGGGLSASVAEALRGKLSRHESDRSQATVTPARLRRQEKEEQEEKP